MNLNRNSLVEKRDLLLFDILEEQKRLSSILSGLVDVLKGSSDTRVKLPSKEKTEVLKDKPEPKKMFDCRFCGGQHEKQQQIAACARKLKKKEGKSK